MTTIYPTGIDGNSQLPLLIDGVSPIRADDVNNIRDAVIAVETELGIDPSSTFGTVKDRLDSLADDVEGLVGGGALLDIFTAKGDLLSYSGSAATVLPVGTNGFVLTANSATSTGLSWAAA